MKLEHYVVVFTNSIVKFLFMYSLVFLQIVEVESSSIVGNFSIIILSKTHQLSERLESRVEKPEASAFSF